MARRLAASGRAPRNESARAKKIRENLEEHARNWAMYQASPPRIFTIFICVRGQCDCTLCS